MHRTAAIARNRLKRRRAFTLIELMVVIAIIGLLTTLIVTGASSVFYQQRVRSTLNTMRTVQIALDQFSTLNPLAAYYDRSGRRSFGSHIPYQLKDPTGGVPADAGQPFYVSHAVEPSPPGPNRYNPNTGFGAGNWNTNRLDHRVLRDIGPFNPNTGTINTRDLPSYVRFRYNPDMSPPRDIDGFDDNRALAAYLQAFVPDAVEQIPANARRPLDPQFRDYINPSGTGGTPGDAVDGGSTPGGVPIAADGIPDWEDVLGIHDAWGVPLDYMLMARVQWSERRNPQSGIPEIGYRIVERKPVLRSLGVDRERYDVNVQALREVGGLRWGELFDRERYLWSDELPRPWLRYNRPPQNTAGNIIQDGFGGPYLGSLRDISGSTSLVPLANGWVYVLERDAPDDEPYVPAQ